MKASKYYLVPWLIALLITVGYGNNEWDPDNGLILHGTIVTMNESMEVIEDGRIVVVGETIRAVLRPGEAIPPGIDVTDAVEIRTNSYIFPGLIDAHNHVAYNFLPLYQVPKKYDNRYQWSSPDSYKRYVNYPKKLINDSKYYDLDVEAIKYAEVKALVGGVTSIQGTPNLRATRILVRNIEHSNFGQDRIYQRGLAVSDKRWQRTVEDGLLRRMNEGEVDAWLVHLAEGIDAKSEGEFQIVKDLGLVNDMAVFIHGTGLKQEHYRQMSDAGTKLVWSPLSNLLLYGQTTDIPTVLEEDVLVCLGADWSPSGMKNLLGSIKIAHHVDEKRFGDVISNEELVKMVTCNPALALGLDDKIGSIKDDSYADIAVFAKVNDDPYLSLIKSTERHLQLVMVGGEPLYGSKAIFEELKPDDHELLEVAGVQKALDVTYEGVDKGEQTFEEISQLLNSAVQFEFEDMYSTFGGGMTEEEFSSFLNKKFSKGIIPMRLDPIYAFGDDHFFNSIRNSTIANLQFDVAQYWEIEKDPDAEVLLFVNSASADFETLDIDVALDIRAARNIVTHRNGADGIYGSADDNMFDDLKELDDIKYVGNSALNKLRKYVSEE